MLMGIENAKCVCDLSEVRNGLPSTAEPAQSSYSVLPLAGCSSNFLHQVPSLTQPARGKQIYPAVPGIPSDVAGRDRARHITVNY